MVKENAWKQVTLWCIMLYIQYSNPQEIFDHAFIQDLDRFIQKTMLCRYIPGLTISVVKDSKTWTKSYGTADFSNGRMVDNSTQFVIGSIAKSFTMVLLGILLTEKGLNWNTKVYDLLGPRYEFIDKYRSKEMTLKDMLSHRTGLAALPIVLDAGYPKSVTRKQLSMKMKHLPQLFSFRDGFVYNNFMYMYLGHISEKLGGDTWENLLQSKVFLPIGMTSTQVLKQPEDLLKDKVAKPYIFRNNEFQNGTLNIYSIHPLEPAGAIISTGVDMAKYIRFNLNNGTTEDGKTLLNPALLNEALTASTPTVNSPFLNSNTLTRPEFPVSDTIIGSGYGWLSAAYRGFRKIWHAGGLFSYVSDAWMFPEINAGVFISSNGPMLKHLLNYGVRTIMYYISDKRIGEDPWLNETTTCEFPHLWRNITTNSTPQEPLGVIDNPSEYIGIYGNIILPSLNVSTKPGDRSKLLFQMNRIGGVLHSTQDKDRFLMEIKNPREYMLNSLNVNNNTMMINTTFLRNQGGEVRSVELQYDVKVVYTKGITIFDHQGLAQATTATIRYLKLLKPRSPPKPRTHTHC